MPCKHETPYAGILLALCVCSLAALSPSKFPCSEALDAFIFPYSVYSDHLVYMYIYIYAYTHTLILHIYVYTPIYTNVCVYVYI